MRRSRTRSSSYANIAFALLTTKSPPGILRIPRSIRGYKQVQSKVNLSGLTREALSPAFWVRSAEY